MPASWKSFPQDQEQGRRAWLHLVQGEVTLGDAVSTTGDGASISERRAISITAREDSEILLIDLAGQAPTGR